MKGCPAGNNKSPRYPLPIDPERPQSTGKHRIQQRQGRSGDEPRHHPINYSLGALCLFTVFFRLFHPTNSRQDASKQPFPVKDQTAASRAEPPSNHTFQTLSANVFQTITIVAPGLLGASLAIAAHQKGVAKNVTLWARRQEAVDALLQKPWCARASTDLAEACRDSELIVLCAPVNRIISLAEEIATFAAGSPIVTDVGSVKADIVRRCEAALAGKARFIGSHPMAGSEKTGMENACGDLFEQRSCFVTPSAQADPEALAQTKAFWQAVGSQVVEESPDRHDEIVAQVSHLPHLLASSLATFLATRCPDAATYCGNGLRDTTRVASGSPELWREIVEQNRPEVLRALRDFQDHLQTLTAAIANESDFDLLQQLADGKQFRDQL